MPGLSVCVKGKVTAVALAPKQGFNDAGELQWQMAWVRASVRVFVGSLAWSFLTTEGADITLAQSDDFADFDDFFVSHLINANDVDALFRAIRELKEGDEFSSLGLLTLQRGAIRYQVAELDVIKRAAPSLVPGIRKVVASQLASIGIAGGASFRDGGSSGEVVAKK